MHGTIAAGNRLNRGRVGVRLHSVTRRQRAVGSRAVPRSGPCFFSGAGDANEGLCRRVQPFLRSAERHPVQVARPRAARELLVPRGYTIDRLRYFTARVSGKIDPAAPARQQIYLKALATLPEIEVHYGRFLAKTMWRPLTNLPVAGRRIETPRPVTLPGGIHPVLGTRRQTLPVGAYPGDSRGSQEPGRRARAPLPDAVIAEVHAMEEKGSDVNLAAYLLNDAWQGLFETAVVISNVTPIWMVTAERNRPVLVVCPGRWQAAPQLRNVASHVRYIRRSMLKAAQFPDTLPGSGISKPTDWLRVCRQATIGMDGHEQGLGKRLRQARDRANLPHGRLLPRLELKHAASLAHRCRRKEASTPSAQAVPR